MNTDFSQVDNLALALNNLGAGNLNFNRDPNAFKKALTVTSGYYGYNLERAVKRFLPVYSILRQRVAVDTGPVGPQSGPSARFKAQLGFGDFNFASSMGTPMAANGNDTDPDALEFSCDYKMQSVHGAVQVPSIDFGRQFDDPLQAQLMMNMAAVAQLDELITVGGNEAALGVPVPTGSSGGSGSTFHSGAWKVSVTALTLQGKLANDKSANVTPQVNSAGANITGSYMGESTPGSVTITATTALYLDVSWPIVPGAVAYKVYVSDAYGDTTDVYLLNPATEISYKDYDNSTYKEKYKVEFSGQKWVGVNHIRIISAPGGTVGVPTADGSASANQFEGMIAWASKTTIGGQNLSSFSRVFSDQDGAVLTSDSAGGISEINDDLKAFAMDYHTGPTAIVASPQTVLAMSSKIASQSMMRFELTKQQDNFVGGIMVGGYLNRFAKDYGMNSSIDIISHVKIPDGFILYLDETLPPATYRYANDGRCWALDVLRPYNYFPLASTDLNINFNIWFLETLKCFYPLAQGVRAGVRVDS